MATWLDAAALIEDRLRAAWTATPPDRLRFENDAYVDMTNLAPFCQVEVTAGPERPYIGNPSNRLSRVEGVLMLHMMTPLAEGRTAARAMLANARSAIANATWKRTSDTSQLEWEDDDWWVGRDHIWIYMQGAGSLPRGASAEDGSYWGMTAAVPFTALYLDTP
ncbi:hypothetical protein [Roseococcus sp. YIM B11640]|uniref:hypothetical protein n=1 Tax=Roseococcus sp. YIM B11640 TaxID=3133973 RepID=UPI003C7A5D02